MLRYAIDTRSQHSERIGIYFRSDDSRDSYRTLQKQAEPYLIRMAQIPAWKFVDVYIGRTGFQRLITDCLNGNVTHIIAKSIGELFENIEEFSTLLRTLNSLPQPVGVYFESEKFDSLGQEEIFAQVFQ